ncbi:hypothetical protein ScPMuIL_018728 [Solemya velum]
MPISNTSAAAGEFKKIAGKEATVGAQFFMKAFSLPGVQDVFSQFKGKAVTEADLHSHGEIVIKFMIDRLAGGASDAGIEEFVTSHKKKPGLNAQLIAASKDVLVDTLAANGLDKTIMATFVDDFIASLGSW